MLTPQDVIRCLTFAESTTAETSREHDAATATRTLAAEVAAKTATLASLQAQAVELQSAVSQLAKKVSATRGYRHRYMYSSSREPSCSIGAGTPSPSSCDILIGAACIEGRSF